MQIRLNFVKGIIEYWTLDPRNRRISLVHTPNSRPPHSFRV